MTSVSQTVTTRPGTPAGANETTAVPPGYKQTDLGLLPDSWEAVRLGDLFIFKNGLNKAKQFFGTGTPIVNYMDVFERPGLRTGDLAGRVNLNPEEIKNFEVRLGDVFFTRTSETVEEVGVASVMLDETHNTVFSGFVLRARPRDDRLDDCYKQYCFASREVRTQIVSNATYTTRALTNGRSLSAVWLAVPPKSEQRAIAEALSDVDKLLGSLEKLIAKKRTIKQAAMQQLLTGKTRLPGFSGEWQNHQVQNVIRQHFCGPSPTCDERNIEGEDEWGVLKTTAATVENGWDWRQHKALPHAYWGREHQKVESGDVIITKAGPRHRVGVTAWVNCVPDRIIVSGKMIGLRPDARRVVPLMLAAALRAREAQIYLDLRTTGMAESQVNFENEDLLEAPILLPAIAEQRAIATVLSDMDAEIAALERRRDKTHAVKQGMMQQLLTGRVRLVRPPRTTEASGR